MNYRRARKPTFIGLLCAVALLTAESYTLAAAVVAVIVDAAWLRPGRLPRWLRKKLREIERSGEKMPTALAGPDGFAFISPTPEAANPIGSLAEMDMPLDYEGLYMVTVTHDGQMFDLDNLRPPVPVEDLDAAGYVFDPKLCHLERYADQHPGEWLIALCEPLRGATWKREAPGRWVCVEVDGGYAE